MTYTPLRQADVVCKNCQNMFVVEAEPHTDAKRVCPHCGDERTVTLQEVLTGDPPVIVFDYAYGFDREA